MIERSFNRKVDQLRPIKFTTNYIKNTAGSVLVECGDTKVIVTATIEDRIPKFITETNSGWITAEYSMLPGATIPRSQRERNKVSGRTMEIQRLIGRSLRAIVDLDKLGEITITIDCDVIQADGGTRTTSINGAYIALYLALKKLYNNSIIKSIPITEPLAAISVGIVNGYELLDLDYQEDSNADVDSNIVITESGKIIEVQCTSEKTPISEITFLSLLQLGKQGIQEVIQLQKQALNI